MTKKKSNPAKEQKVDFGDGVEETQAEGQETLFPEVGTGEDGSLPKPPTPEESKGAASDEATEAIKKQIEREVYERLQQSSATLDKLTANREWYAREGKRRFKCVVRSNRSGVQSFEMSIPHPDNVNRPVIVRGQCDVIIEEGLTWFAIKRLQETHHQETRKKANIDPEADIALTMEQFKVFDYTVELMGEVKQPKPVGFGANTTASVSGIA